MKHLEVVGAIIEYNGKILCMQRPSGRYEYTSLKWEFPGGKIETGETQSQALMRELREEMSFIISISDRDYFSKVDYEYPDFSITMYCYLCHSATDVFERKEHVDSKWLLPADLCNLDWAAADFPIVKEIQAYYYNK